MNAPPEPPSIKAKENYIGSKLKPTVSFGLKGESDKNLVILVLAMFAAGIFLMALGGYEIKGSQESRNWPSTRGTITYSGVHKSIHTDSNHRTKTTYIPKVAYRYQVKGRQYTGDRIEFGVGESGGSMKSAQKIMGRYPSGKKVPVYYNPQDPKYGILEAGFTWRSIFAFLGGVVFFAAGVFCLKAYLRNRRKTGIS